MRRWLLLTLAMAAGMAAACHPAATPTSYAATDAALPIGKPLPEAQARQVKALLQTLPSADNQPLDEMQAITLAAFPLSCMDHPQAAGGGGGGGAAALGADAAPGAGVAVPAPEAGAAAAAAGGAQGGANAGGEPGNAAAGDQAAGGGGRRGGRGRRAGGAAADAGAGATPPEAGAAPAANTPVASGAVAPGGAPGATVAGGRGGRGGAGGGGRGPYLWQTSSTTHLLDNYAKERAFYGCFDWHSSVNSTWTLVMVLKHYPGLPIDKFARSVLDNHLGASNIAGEMAYFQHSPNYERPYGQAWAMKLYNELATWKDPDAQRWAANLKPLVTQFATGMVKYFNELPDPVRTGVHPNTANAMKLMLPYAETNDPALQEAIERNARRFFLADEDCPTGFEPEGASFLSPCLSEAYIMSELLDQPHFVAWFDNFMPPIYSKAEKPLLVPFDASMMKKPELLAAKSHLVGLAFSRAEAYLAISNALPATDARVAVFRRLGAIHGVQGFEGMDAAGYLSSHWTASYAMMYEFTFNPSFKLATSTAKVAELQK